MGIVTRTSTLLAAVCGLLSWGGIDADDTIEAGKLAFTFAPAEAGMGLVSISGPGGVQFLKRPTDEKAAKLWRVKLTPDVSSEDNFITISNASPCAARSFTAPSNVEASAILAWQGIDVGDETGVLDVFLTVSKDAPTGFADLRIRVVNRSTKYAVWRVLAPDLELGVINGDGSDDYLLMSPAEGRSVRNPIYWGKDQDLAKNELLLTTDGEVKIDRNRSATGFGFGAKEPYGLPYPSARCQMQLNAYYQKQGDFYYPSDGAFGLYLAAHDPQAYPKTFYATDHPQRELLHFAVGHYPDAPTTPATNYAQPYSMLIGFFEGDWYDAAQVYRKFALTAPWLKEGTLATRGDVPDWLRRTTAWIRLDGSKNRRPDTLRECLSTYRKYLRGTLGVQWYAWDKGLAPHYQGVGSVPAIAEAMPGYDAVVRDFQKQRCRFLHYMNSRLWGQGEPGVIYQQPVDVALPHIQHNCDGSPSFWQPGKFGTTWYRMCLFREFWHRYLVDVVQQHTARYPVDGIYLDQAGELSWGGGIYSSQGCYRQDHDHPPGVTIALTRAEEMRVRKIKDSVSGRAERLVLCGEGTAENFIDTVPLKIIHYEIWPGNVPVFNAVYHDYMAGFGRTVTLRPRQNADPIGAMTIGWQLVLGNQIGRLWPYDIRRDAVTQKNFRYLMKAVALREAASDFLNLGQMLRPPRLTEVPQLTTAEFKKLNHLCTLPSVLASTWRDPAGRVAFVITNISEDDQSFTLSADLADYGLPSDHEMLQRFPGNKDLAVSRNGSRSSLQMTMPALEAILVELVKPGERPEVIRYDPLPLPALLKYPPHQDPRKPIEDFSLRRGFDGWSVNNDRVFSIKTSADGRRYIALHGQVGETGYVVARATVPVKFIPGQTYKFGARVTARHITPQHRAAVSVRLVNDRDRTVTYRDIKITRTLDNEMLPASFRRKDEHVKYMQYCIRAMNLPKDAVIEVSDMYLAAIE